MTQLIRKLVLVNIIAVFCLTAFAAYATEGGGGSYANGAEDSMSGNVPPHGLWYINYTNFYRADSFKDNNGDTLMNKDQFKATVFANVSRFIYTSKIKVLGGDLGGHLLLTLVNADIKTPAGEQTKSGLNDIDIAPFIAWHTKNFHWVVANEFILPTGAYDKDDVANIGRNCYTFEPLIAVTYIADNGFELTGKFMYDINTENNHTNYKSGNEFHVDYTAAMHRSKWTFGANGYYYQQVTDDELDGETVDDFKGKAIALGPMISYAPTPVNFVTLKYQKEFDVENRPSGDKVWIKVLFKF